VPYYFAGLIWILVPKYHAEVPKSSGKFVNRYAIFKNYIKSNHSELYIRIHPEIISGILILSPAPTDFLQHK